MAPLSHLLLFVAVLGATYVHGGFIVNPGPAYPATVGHPSPLPKQWKTSENFFSVDAENFTIRSVGGESNALLNNATQRYTRIIAGMAQRTVIGTREAYENSVQYQVRTFSGSPPWLFK